MRELWADTLMSRVESSGQRRFIQLHFSDVLKYKLATVCDLAPFFVDMYFLKYDLLRKPGECNLYGK